MPFIAIRILARVFSLMIISVLIDCCIFMFTCGLTTGNHGDIEAAGIFLGAVSKNKSLHFYSLSEKLR